MDWEPAGGEEGGTDSPTDGWGKMDWEPEGGEEALEEKKPPKKKDEADDADNTKGLVIALLISALLLVTVFGLLGSLTGSADNETFNWPTTGLAALLPEPSSSYGTVMANSSDELSVRVEKLSQEDYEAYVASCKEAGYTLEAEEGSSEYEAYSADGYLLSLSYVSRYERMTIELEAPITLETISWPTTGVGVYAPVPTSTMGKVQTNRSDCYSAYVGDTSAEEYSAYVTACMDAGFNVDYSVEDTSFYADNADGIHIEVDYVSLNTMLVTVETPSDDSDEGSVVDYVRETIDEYQDIADELAELGDELSSSE